MAKYFEKAWEIGKNSRWVAFQKRLGSSKLKNLDGVMPLRRRGKR